MYMYVPSVDVIKSDGYAVKLISEMSFSKEWEEICLVVKNMSENVLS